MPYFQILCLAGIAICLQGVNFNAVAAVGKSKIMFHWTIIKRGIGLCLIVGGLAVCGMRGLLLGMVASAWFIYFVNAYLVDRHVGYKLLNQLKDLMPILVLSTVSIIVPYGITLIMPNFNMFLIAVIQFIVFTVIFWGGSVCFKLESYRYCIEYLPLIIQRIRK